MNDKIIKIIIFTIAIIDCLLALVFAGSFNNDKKDNYIQTERVKAMNPAMLSDFEDATPESLSVFLTKYQAELASRTDSLKNVQRQKDILYTYLQDLKDLNQDNFEAYKKDFPVRSAGLFAKCDRRQAYIDGFAGVETCDDLEKYVSDISDEYAILKQDYLEERGYLKAANAFIAQVDQIDATASKIKKESELKELQDDVKNFNANAGLQNAILIIAYILFCITVFMMLFFAGIKLVTSFKTSYKVLLVLLLFGVIFLVGFLVGTPELSVSAVRQGMTPGGYKLVNACTFSLYVTLLAAIVAVIVSAIYSTVKNKA